MPAPAAAPVRYGGFWRRLFAWWIDAILLWIAGGLIRVGLGVPLFDIEWGDPRLMMAGFTSTAVAWLYSALLESSARQATLGQQILGIKVTDLALRRISFGRATGRYFAQIISVFTLMIGYLIIAFTARKQALHDMIAGCLVVRGE